MASGREETQRVPPSAPLVSCRALGIEDDEVKLPFFQQVADREAGLAPANHDDLVVPDVWRFIHNGNLPF